MLPKSPPLQILTRQIPSPAAGVRPSLPCRSRGALSLPSSLHDVAAAPPLRLGRTVEREDDMADSHRGSPLELALGLLDPVLLLIAAQDPSGLALPSSAGSLSW
jgi:hypothetical protein